MLYGEETIFHVERAIQCEHGISQEYLRVVKDAPNFKAFSKKFTSINGQLQITNYRLIFIPNLELSDAQIMEK